MAERVFVVGATGKVGRALVAQIHEKGDTDSHHTNPTLIVGLASSSSYLFNIKGIDRAECENFTSKATKGTKYSGVQELVEVLRWADENSNQLRVIDVTASSEMLTLHKAVINGTGHTIVTANKRPLAECTYEEFRLLTREPMRYGYACSVMAGAEAVPFLRDVVDLGERPSEIIGCFSGTLGYLTTQLERGRALSEVVAEAVKLGYTEPNPEADLSGRDVASKILILARTAGFGVNMEDIMLQPFVPQRFLVAPDAASLLVALRNADKEVSEEFLEASKDGERPRYVARAVFDSDAPRITVGLARLDASHPLAELTGTSNKILITTGPYRQSGGYAIQAPGAGIEITARNIRKDLLYQIAKRRLAANTTLLKLYRQPIKTDL